MTARERLSALLAPGVLDALDELIAQRVAELGPVSSGASPWLRRRDAAAYLGVSPSWLAHDKTIPSYQDCPSGTVFYFRPALDEWRLANQRR